MSTLECLRGEFLSPYCFLYINNLCDVGSHYELSVFADDVALFKEICSGSDCDFLQEDLNNFQILLHPLQILLRFVKRVSLHLSGTRSHFIT